MKKILFFFLFFGYFYQTNAQEISFTPNTSHYEIIIKLFEGRWDSLKQECVWKPNLAEKYDYQTPNNNNDSLYTRLEKIFHYTIKDDLYILFITSTFEKDNEDDYTISHCCSTVLMSVITLKYDKNKERVNLESFKKYVTYHGYAAIPASIELVEIGENEYCIQINDTNYATGETTGSKSLYYKGQEILRFTDYGEYDSFSGCCTYKYSTTMTIDKAAKKITLHKKGTELITNLSDNTHNVVPVDEIKTYKFNGVSFELVTGN